MRNGSPLSAWLEKHELNQADLAVLSGTDRGDICRVANGRLKLQGPLRTFLEGKAPTLVRAQDRYFEARKRELASALV